MIYGLIFVACMQGSPEPCKVTLIRNELTKVGCEQERIARRDSRLKCVVWLKGADRQW